MMARRLPTNGCGVPATSPASTTFFMFSSSAEANTSAGAPSMIWRASVDEPAKLNSTLVPGWAVSKSFPMVRNASVSDAAAKTVTVSARAAVVAANARPRKVATSRVRRSVELAVVRMAVRALLPCGNSEDEPSGAPGDGGGVDGRVPLWSGQPDEVARSQATRRGRAPRAYRRAARPRRPRQDRSARADRAARLDLRGGARDAHVVPPGVGAGRRRRTLVRPARGRHPDGRDRRRRRYSDAARP